MYCSTVHSALTETRARYARALRPSLDREPPGTGLPSIDSTSEVQYSTLQDAGIQARPQRCATLSKKECVLPTQYRWLLRSAKGLYISTFDSDAVCAAGLAGFPTVAGGKPTAFDGKCVCVCVLGRLTTRRPVVTLHLGSGRSRSVFYANHDSSKSASRGGISIH